MATSAKKKMASGKGKTAIAVRPIKENMTKSALLSMIAEKNEITRKQAGDVLATLESIIMGCVHPSSVGTFILPGLFKIVLRKVPARPAGTMIRNPATGEMMKAAAKPASVRVKIRPLSKLKAAALR